MSGIHLQEYVFTKETADFILDKFMLEISLVKVILISARETFLETFSAPIYGGNVFI